MSPVLSSPPLGPFVSRVGSSRTNIGPQLRQHGATGCQVPASRMSPEQLGDVAQRRLLVAQLSVDMPQIIDPPYDWA